VLLEHWKMLEGGGSEASIQSSRVAQLRQSNITQHAACQIPFKPYLSPYANLSRGVGRNLELGNTRQRAAACTYRPGNFYLLGKTLRRAFFARMTSGARPGLVSCESV
jgi:hypothetical protein